MKKLIILLLVLSGNTGHMFGQTSDDALRYSRIFFSGTSRFMGMGGAFGAVGADFSSLAINPAGIGLYQSSEISLTIAPMVGNSRSNYYGNISTDSKVNFALGNFGFIFTIKPYNKNKSGGLKNFNIGFGMNRQNDFNNRIYISGENPTSSMMQSYVNELNAKGISPNLIRTDYPFDIGLAYDANLIYQDTNNKYLCDARYGGVYQNKIIDSYGSINELEFSVGGNFNDKLYFGITVGVPFIRYYENSTYQERDVADTIPEFIYLNYWYSLQTHGTGVNFKAGLIYRPLNWFRVGLSVHTPTWFASMQDEWYSSMESHFSTTSWNSTQYSPIGNFNYQLITPFRATCGLAFILGQYGLISADYEYVNYSQSRFSSSSYSFDSTNREIKNSYGSWGNIRLGTEWRIQDFRIRGGFAYFSNAYKNGINNNQRFQVSGGIGYRGRYFFADVSYVWSMMKEDYYLYDPSMVNPSHNTLYTHTVLTSVGIRF